MGIPAYFSNILKNHPQLLQNYNNCVSLNIELLHMDCNSIIYDAYHLLCKSKTQEIDDITTFETQLIAMVQNKIEEYILKIKPTHVVHITFDGVAPFAKIQQQRERRLKTALRDTNNTDDNTLQKWNWSTSNITPGTMFMNTLSKTIKKYFMQRGCKKKYGVKTIIVSGSTEVGEGEHKIFSLLRTSEYIAAYENCTIGIYGLDSDLIMLSLCHLCVYPNIYLLREVPDYFEEYVVATSDTKANTDPTDILGILDIPLLSEQINIQYEINPLDYIFLCFLLGNDFLPHFPSLQLRQNGLSILTEMYKNISNTSLHVEKFMLIKSEDFIKSDTNSNINNKKMPTFVIMWKNVGILFKKLAKTEEELFQMTHDNRNKAEKIIKNNMKHQTAEEINNRNMTPSYHRPAEKYINPHAIGWEHRYYKALFRLSTTNTYDIMKINNISYEYVQGLEWVFRYYTETCIDWKWHYAYSYPPLLLDIAKKIPDTNNTSLFKKHNTNVLTPTEQLKLVMPPATHVELEKKRETHGTHTMTKIFNNYCTSFNKYDWECHLENV